MLREPPEILITTPESLNLLLSLLTILSGLFHSRHEIATLIISHRCVVWERREKPFRCMIKICESYLEVLGVQGSGKDVDSIGT